MRVAALLVGLGAIPHAALAQEVKVIPLEEALAGATAMTALNATTLIVASNGGSFLCDITIDPNFFPSIKEGMAEAAAYYAPSAICVASSAIKSAGKN